MMCKPHKHQGVNGSASVENVGARNFRLTQDKIKDLFAEESKSAIEREIEASSCEDRLCDCGNSRAEMVEELLYGDSAKKMVELNVQLTLADS